MQNIELLMASLEYIEQHICEDIKTEDIAKECYCSKSTLEKLFRCVNHISVRDYIIRRRMTLAARRIAKQPEESILDIALDYGYSTHESFARAFKSVWNCKPSEFRNRKFTDLFPRIEPCMENGDNYMSKRRHVDISQLYDLFKERKDCYFVCCDIKSLVPINEISHKAGDLAILESLNRMNQVAGEDDIVFRIGGDEFCMLTNSTDSAYAEAKADMIRACNGNTFDYEGREIPLSLHVVVTKPEMQNVRYSELFVELHTALRNGKC